LPTGSKIDQKLREVEAALATGLTVNQAVRQVGISKLTYYRSRKFAKEEVEEEEVSRPTGSKKSPVRAFVLAPIVAIGLIGLLDGSGQFYNGEVAKGFGFMGLSLGSYGLIYAGFKADDGADPRVFLVPVGFAARAASYVWAAGEAHESAIRSHQHSTIGDSVAGVPWHAVGAIGLSFGVPIVSFYVLQGISSLPGSFYSSSAANSVSLDLAPEGKGRGGMLSFTHRR